MDEDENYIFNKPHRPINELPGDVVIPLFKDRIAHAHKISQIGLIMVKVPKHREPLFVSKIQAIMRKLDSVCISAPGTIIILLAKQASASTVEIVVNKIKKQLADVKDLYISGLFVPYPAIEFDDIVGELEKHIYNIDNIEGDVTNYFGICKECNVNHCIMRDDLKFTTCIGPNIFKPKDRGTDRNSDNT